MNYRHAYHAGNFADVLKHAVMALVIEHLKLKTAPFRVIDAHAGAGVYDLSLEAERTGEWRNGIGRLIGHDIAPAAAATLAPYLSAVRAENPEGGLLAYPGSPYLARRLIRDEDRLVLNELHPDDRERLRDLFRGDSRAKILGLDAWIALKSLLPPRERRGLVLIDPPFEAEGEFARLVQGLSDGMERFGTGVFVVWYPIKDKKFVAAFHAAAARLGLAKILRAELAVETPRFDAPLSACGLLVVNPPFTLFEQLSILLPFLSSLFARGAGASHNLDWIGTQARRGA